MDRVTDKQLQAIVDRINRVMGTPMEPYARASEAEQWAAQIGNYHLSGAYGGKSLHRMVSDGGGISDVFGCGHVSKRELADRMYAFLRGVELARESNEQQREAA